MIGRGGAVEVRELASNNVLARHKGEGAGTRVAFLQGGNRLLIMDAGQKNLHLVDIAGGNEIATRSLSGSNGKPIVALIAPDADLLAFIDDEQLIRLSIDDLKEAATFKIEDADEYAMALAPDKTTIYLAAAKVILNGRLMALDSKTLALQRTFGRVFWGAKGMSLSSRWNVLALRGLGGVDFYDIKAGERVSHVSANFPMVGGRFLGGSNDSDYVGFGSDGSIRRWAPELGTDTAGYMTIDGGAIEQLDPLPDRSGFLSISDRPSITNWAYEARSISKEYSTPLVVNGIHLNMLTPLAAYNFSTIRDEVTASYIGNVVQRWNVESGVMKIVKQAGPKEEAIDHVAGLQNGISVIGRPSGQIQIYSDADGAAQPVGALKFEPLGYLGELGASHAFLVTKSGAAARLDVSTPSEPKIEMLPALAKCAGKVAIPGFAVCLSADGHMRILRDADATLAADWPAPPEGVATAFIRAKETKLATAAASDANRIMFSEKFACPVSGFTISEIEPRLFSFNNPFGACPACGGLGLEQKIDADLVIPDRNATLRKGAIAPWSRSTSPYYTQTLEALAKFYKFALDTKWKDLPKKVQDASSTAPARTPSASFMTTACARTRPRSRSRASSPIWSAGSARARANGRARNCRSISPTSPAAPATANGSSRRRWRSRSRAATSGPPRR